MFCVLCLESGVLFGDGALCRGLGHCFGGLGDFLPGMGHCGIVWLVLGIVCVVELDVPVDCVGGDVLCG